MLATPDVSHLSKDDFLRVYEPAEDSFCLLDALEQDQELVKRACPRLVVEIGSGSGIVSAFVGQIIGPDQAAFLCTDINEAALSATLSTGQANGVRLSPIRTHLLDLLQHRCQGSIDLLLFNPPYVPTSDEEEQAAQRHRLLAGSWAGGSFGTALLEELMATLPTLLSAGGLFYLVTVQQNDPSSIVQKLTQAGLHAEICLSRRAGREHLHIIRAIRSNVQPT